MTLDTFYTALAVYLALQAYILAGVVVMLRCEQHCKPAMNQVVGFRWTGGLVCWVLWPWTALVVLTLHWRSRLRRPASE